MSHEPPLRVYGRRRGRRLRVGRARLLAELLPRLEIPEAPEPVDPAALFDDPIDGLWLEIGFGAGEHMVAQAAAHPTTGMIGCEPFINGVARALVDIDSRTLRNVRLFPGDARMLLPRLPDASVDRVFLLFPDPWPKRRHRDRRFVNQAPLDELSRVMRDHGILRIASDEMGYIRWTLRWLQGHRAFAWTARRPSDWRERPADWPPTRYEAKARAQGRIPAFLEFRRLPRAEIMADPQKSLVRDS